MYLSLDFDYDCLDYFDDCSVYFNCHKYFDCLYYLDCHYYFDRILTIWIVVTIYNCLD